MTASGGPARLAACTVPSRMTASARVPYANPLAQAIVDEVAGWHLPGAMTSDPDRVGLPTDGTELHPYCPREARDLFGRMAGSPEPMLTGMLVRWLEDYWPRSQTYGPAPARRFPSEEQLTLRFWSHAADLLAAGAIAAADLAGPRDPPPWELLSGWLADLGRSLTECRHAVLSCVAQSGDRSARAAVSAAADDLRRVASLPARTVDGRVFFSVGGAFWPALGNGVEASSRQRADLEKSVGALCFSQLGDVRPMGRACMAGRDMMRFAQVLSQDCLSLILPSLDGRTWMDPARGPSVVLADIDRTVGIMQSPIEALGHCRRLAARADSPSQTASLRWM